MNTQRVNQQVTIEHMTQKEVEIALEWAAAEGWNPGINDAECFYHTDPHGFYAAKLRGEIVGTMSVVKYSDNFAFGGLYIVKPKFRGLGIGLRMQQFVLDNYNDVNVGIDGVVEMQEKYEQDGFHFAHNNTRYAGVIKGKRSQRCVPIRKQDFQEVAAFDSAFFPAPRPRFLRKWLFQNDTSSQLIRNKVGNICSYGVIRKCRVGYKIGPLFADNLSDAEQLLTSLAVTADGETVFLDVPEANTAAVELAIECGMLPVFNTVRMYTKTAPPLPLKKIYGITTFELG